MRAHIEAILSEKDHLGTIGIERSPKFPCNPGIQIVAKK